MLKTQALIGKQATKAAIEQQMPTARIIHLATHGLLDELSESGIPGAVALAPSPHYPFPCGRILSSSCAFLTARFRRRSDAEAHLQALRRLKPSLTLAIISIHELSSKTKWLQARVITNVVKQPLAIHNMAAIATTQVQSTKERRSHISFQSS